MFQVHLHLVFLVKDRTKICDTEALNRLKPSSTRSTLQVQPQRGRVFTDSDVVAGTPVVLVNQSFAQKYWPSEEALGKRLRVKEKQLFGPWLTVAGVVPEILQNFRHHLQHDPLIYLPFADETSALDRPHASSADDFGQRVPARSPALGREPGSPMTCAPSKSALRKPD